MVFTGALKWMSIFLVGTSLVVLLLTSILWFFSPGSAQPILDTDGRRISNSISTIETVTLGGVEQSLIIRGHDQNAPVMLFLHGGPGSPEFPMIRQTNTGLEQNFVMVYWEQRGAGKSFSSAVLSETMTLDQFVSDTQELSKFLIKRFEQERIFLMGHSWGSLLGLVTVHRHPNLYHTYFGVGQNAADLHSAEQVSLGWARERATATGNTKAAEALVQLTVPDRQASDEDWLTYLQVQRTWLNRLGGGASHEPISMVTLLRWVLATPEYSIADKVNYFRGALFSLKTLSSSVITTNLFAQIDAVQIPVVILQGQYDYQTPYPLAHAFFDHLEAPHKAFYEFENSAHSPIFEEPEYFNSIIRRHAGLE